ncbi:MAG: MFS transporter, partial [Desulfatirhabdiaceae bacterium]
YMDGVDTIIRMAIDYGLSIGFESRDLILALLLVQFIGFPAALVFGRLAHRIGERNAIVVAILGYSVATLWGCVMTEKMDFYFLAGLIGCFQGGIQAFSRSFFARFIPSGQESGYFGLMNMTGKMAAIAGPALVAVVGLISRYLLTPPNPLPEQIVQINQLSSRIGMGSVLLLFAAGVVLLSYVKEPPENPLTI